MQHKQLPTSITTLALLISMSLVPSFASMQKDQSPSVQGLSITSPSETSQSITSQLNDAKNVDELKQVFNSVSSSLNMTIKADLKTSLFFGDKLLRLGDEQASDTHFEDLLNTIEASSGDESFAYLYAAIHNLRLSVSTPFRRYAARLKRLWREVDNFADETKNKQQLLDLLALVQKIKAKGPQFGTNGQHSSIARVLSKNADKMLDATSAERIAIDLYAANLFIDGRKNKDGAQLLKQVAQRIDNAELETDFETEIRKKLVRFFDLNRMPEYADEQVIKMAEKLRKSNIDLEPERIFGIDPRYPVLAAKKGLSGEVSLSFDIAKNGRTENIKIVSVDGHDSFGDSAKNALSRWRYLPQIEDGTLIKAVDRTIVLEFSFLH